MSALFDLQGKRAVVTGASRGIGASVSMALADAGAEIIAVSSTINDTSPVVQEIRRRGRHVEPVACDLSDRTATIALSAELATRDVDILFSNAGIIERAPAAEHPVEGWDRVLEVNLSSQFLLAQAVGRSMLARGRGKIVFTASLLSFQGGVNVPGYAAAKHGIAGITKALANEWAAGGVNVNAIAPGYIATDNTEALRSDPDRSHSILSRIPAGRWGTATDLDGPALFLCSAASDYVHGTVLAVDGGWLAR